LNIDEYLLDFEYLKLPNRQYICSLLNSLMGDAFKEYTKIQMRSRVRQVVSKKDLRVKALPEFIKIFRSSESIYVQKGRFHYLIKMSGKLRWGEVELSEKKKLKDKIRKTERQNLKI